jgi:hypothetical protein
MSQSRPSRQISTQVTLVPHPPSRPPADVALLEAGEVAGAKQRLQGQARPAPEPPRSGGWSSSSRRPAAGHPSPAGQRRSQSATHRPLRRRPGRPGTRGNPEPSSDTEWSRSRGHVRAPTEVEIEQAGTMLALMGSEGEPDLRAAMRNSKLAATGSPDSNRWGQARSKVRIWATFLCPPGSTAGRSRTSTCAASPRSRAISSTSAHGTAPRWRNLFFEGSRPPTAHGPSAARGRICSSPHRSA